MVTWLSCYPLFVFSNHVLAQTMHYFSIVVTHCAVISLLIPPSSALSLSLGFFYRLAQGRGCQSSCAPHLGRSASTAKELWVSVSLHSNAWQVITIIAETLFSPYCLSLMSGNLFIGWQDEARSPHFTHLCQITNKRYGQTTFNPQ